MPRYAIKVVPPDWKDSMPLPFSQTSRAYGKIERGMRVLIYQVGMGIVGDAEVCDSFIPAGEWLGEELPASVAAADYLLPLESIYYRGKVVAPDTVRELLDDPTFPQLDGYRPIDAQLYQQFIRLLL
jgi:hypothetical protein